MQVEVEILQQCGDWSRGDRQRLAVRKAENLVRTGYARMVENTDASGAGEKAVRPTAATRTVRGERRG